MVEVRFFPLCGPLSSEKSMSIWTICHSLLMNVPAVDRKAILFGDVHASVASAIALLLLYSHMSLHCHIHCDTLAEMITFSLSLPSSAAARTFFVISILCTIFSATNGFKKPSTAHKHGESTSLKG